MDWITRVVMDWITRVVMDWITRVVMDLITTIRMMIYDTFIVYLLCFSFVKTTSRQHKPSIM